MKQLNLGKIKKVFLFGGGTRLRNATVVLKESGLDIFVFTSKRFLEDIEKDLSFKQFLEKNKIDFESTEDINSNKKLDEIMDKEFLGVSFGAPWIFKEKLIRKFNNRLLNAHNRNLPRNRGGGGFSWMILNQEKNSASLLHLVDTGIDTGQIVKMKEFSFPKNCKTPKDFETYAIEEDKKFFKEFPQNISNHFGQLIGYRGKERCSKDELLKFILGELPLSG